MTGDRYRWVSAVYDVLALVYSLGAMDRCKRDSVSDVTPGERVLIAGAGHGGDAVEALRLGAHVTMVELPPSMCGHFRRRLKKAGLSDCERLRVVQGDILAFEVPLEGPFDRVIANLFLNILGLTEMRTVLLHAFAGDVRHGVYSLDEIMRQLGLELAPPRRFGLYWSLRGRKSA